MNTFSGRRRSHPRHWLALLFVVLIAVFMMFIVPTLLVQACAIAVLFLMSSFGWVASKLFFERGRIDLLSRPNGH
jgi:uncharacterized membrane protein YdbT with pleckstrin-like domain